MDCVEHKRDSDKVIGSIFWGKEECENKKRIRRIVFLKVFFLLPLVYRRSVGYVVVGCTW